jgi:hypothetical protein
MPSAAAVREVPPEPLAFALGADNPTVEIVVFVPLDQVLAIHGRAPMRRSRASHSR